MEDIVVKMVKSRVRLENVVDSYSIYGAILGFIVSYPDWHAVSEMS